MVMVYSIQYRHFDGDGGELDISNCLPIGTVVVIRRRRFCIDLGPLRGSSSRVDALSRRG